LYFSYFARGLCGVRRMSDCFLVVLMGRMYQVSVGITPEGRKKRPTSTLFERNATRHAVSAASTQLASGNAPTHQIGKLVPFTNSLLHFFDSLDINNSPRADVWQPVVFLNLSGHPGI
jgi:hypothetical protein